MELVKVKREKSELSVDHDPEKHSGVKRREVENWRSKLLFTFHFSAFILLRNRLNQ